YNSPLSSLPTHRSTRVGTGHAAAVPPSNVMNSRRLMSNKGLPPRRPVGVPTQLPAGYPVALGRNVYPQKHDQDDQDRVQRDPHDVGSPTASILYGLLAHG